MPLSIGTRLGPYEILSALGAGGMGEVYRAHDTKLKRDVALKILPESFAADPDRLARFHREAEVLASLNHPHIAAIHGFEDSGEMHALVMELVEGEDLSQRIARGPIPLDEALPIATQIAEALEAAHEQGIIHRDLKPANIKVTPSGVVKVLDFGLAKLADPAIAGASTPNISMSPTITSPAMMTGVGMLIGTAAYMSPEQAKGRPADKRSDIWAFGCVVYEMLIGRRAFEGEDVSDTLANVLKADPDWMALPNSTPPAIKRLLRRCLEKDRKRRLDSAADARLEIEEAIIAPRGADAADQTRKHLGWRGVTALVGGALFLLMIGGLIAWNVKPAERAPGPARVLLSVAPADELAPTSANQPRPTRTAMALSPDGESMVFTATKGGQRQLYLRAMNRLEATPIPGTENADSPFFSPDGQWVGFWQGELRVGTSGVLKKVPLAGGPAETICRSPYLYGASWGTRNTIVFANGTAGLWQVSADGGAPKSLTSLDTKKGEYSHRLPQMLPGGDAVLFTIERTQYLWDDAQVVVRSLATGEQKVLIDGGADARYVPTGHLVYARMGTLMAVPFDPLRLEVTGRPRGIVENVMQSVNTTGGLNDTGAAQFSVSASGSLVYLPGGAFPEADRILVSVDRNGAAEPLPVSTRNVSVPRLSPDGEHLAYNTVTRGDEAVWIYDIRRGTTSRLTTEGQNSYAIWTPDGKRVTFRSRTAGRSNLFWKAADGTGTNQRLTTSDRDQTPTSWSPDGKVLAFMQRPLVGVAGTNWDIWTLSFQDGGAKARPFLETPAFEQYAEFSPDGRWLAYSSNESGRDEVYVQPYPGPGGRQQVSTEGGAAPAWARNGHEIFYTTAQPSGAIRMMAVDVTLGATFAVGKPRMLFEGLYSQTLTGRSYDVTPDGRRFFMVQPKQQSPEPPFTNVVLVQNWFEELKRLVPTK